MVSRLLFQHISKWQLLAAMTGTIIGMFLLLIAIQLFVDTRQILFEKDKLVQDDLLIINKPVTVFGNIRNKRAVFSDKEITVLKAQPFVLKVAPVVSNDFSVNAYIEGNDQFPGFFTELFFEAIPDGYLDVESDDWQWQEGSDWIPIVIPKDYLDIYNFGFSSSQELPQLSENLINKINFKISIQGANGNAIYQGRIVDFSSRIQSILVPYNFLIWANNKFGSPIKGNPSRLIIITKDPSDPAIYTYFEKENYETGKDKIRNSMLSSFLKFLLLVTAFIAIVIVVMAVLVFMLNFQLILTRNAEKINNLIAIGYSYRRLRNYYLWGFFIVIIIVDFISILLLYFTKVQYYDYLENIGFETNSGISPLCLLAALLFNIVIYLLNFLLADRQMKKTS